MAVLDEMNSINGIEGTLIDRCLSEMFDMIRDKSKPIDRNRLEHILLNFAFLIDICRKK